MDQCTVWLSRHTRLVSIKVKKVKYQYCTFEYNFKITAKMDIKAYGLLWYGSDNNNDIIAMITWYQKGSFQLNEIIGFYLAHWYFCNRPILLYFDVCF